MASRLDSSISGSQIQKKKEQIEEAKKELKKAHKDAPSDKSKKCKKHQVPVEKIYSKTQRDKFAWAFDMTDENFRF